MLSITLAWVFSTPRLVYDRINFRKLSRTYNKKAHCRRKRGESPWWKPSWDFIVTNGPFQLALYYTILGYNFHRWVSSHLKGWVDTRSGNVATCIRTCTRLTFNPYRILWSFKTYSWEKCFVHLMSYLNFTWASHPLPGKDFAVIQSLLKHLPYTILVFWRQIEENWKGKTNIYCL